MKKALLVTVCALAAAACENRPAQDPSSASSNGTQTTQTTSTTSPASHGTTASNKPSAARTSGQTSTPTMTESETHTPARLREETPATGSATAPATTGVTPGPTATNNPGVADGSKDATNTKINDRDRHDALTPTDQGGGKDTEITAAIRRAVVGDGSLSFTAKNVKIITVGGKVTLRGPVKSDEEKKTIEAKAKSTAGVSEVDNQLEVKK